MEKVEKKITFKDKIDIIKKDISRRRDKKSLKEGSIIYFGDRDKIGICLSKDEYVTINEDEINKKVVKEPIYHSIEYYVGSIGKESFGSENLKKIVESCIDESNIMGFKYKNSYEFASKKVNEDIKKKSISKDLLSLKEKLKSDYKIDKWYSTFTSLSVKELEDKIEEKKKEKEKIKNDFEKNKKNNEEIKQKIENEINQKNEFEIKIQNTNISIEDKEKFNEELKQLLDNTNFDELLKELEELEKSNKENEIKFIEETNKINQEIQELNIELEIEKKEEMSKSKELTKSLEKNLEKLKKELNKSKLEDVEELVEDIEELQGIASEIKDENFDGKNKIIQIINEIAGISNTFKKGSAVMLGWDLSLNEFQKLGINFFNLLSIYENNPNLKQLINKIGRKVEKEDKTSEIIDKINEYGKEELLGVELSNDIMRVLPSELVYLSNEETEDIFYLKYLEKKLLCYSLIGEEHEEKEKKIKTEEKGAIIALLDTSGSMMGSPIENARAVLLQAFKIAKLDKRDMKVILFGSYGQIREYIVNEQYDINNFINFISGAYSGGTDFETPITNAINTVTKDKKYKFADIFMLTDGACGVSTNLENKIKEAKKKLDLKIYTVIFGSWGYGSIDNFSDEVLRL